jgi:hypothetical protein
MSCGDSTIIKYHIWNTPSTWTHHGVAHIQKSVDLDLESKFLIEQRLTSSPGLVRFVPRSDPSKTLIGQPEDDSIDVGVAVSRGEDVRVNVFSGVSVLAPGRETGLFAVIDQVLSPLEVSEVGAIRCIGLNVGLHLVNESLVLELLLSHDFLIQTTCRRSRNVVTDSAYSLPVSYAPLSFQDKCHNAHSDSEETKYIASITVATTDHSTKDNTAGRLRRL